MTIDPLHSAGPLNPAQNATQASKKQAANASSKSVSGDSLSLDNSKMVEQALKSTPEIRPEVVARGKQLAADPNYPSQDVINKVAQLITPLNQGL